jgi:anthranilate phosphoribosyltransferase
MKEALNNLFEYKSLEKSQAKEILINLAQGQYNKSQVAAFLTVFLMRSITVDELEGFRDAMLELCIPLHIDEYDAIDLCGTGGDGKDTFNISTLASFIVAGAGQRVAKHGNNGVSSICGSSNLLAYFGYEFTNDKDALIKSIEEAGICFLHAPLFHPAMKNVAPIRQELGVKTFFNMLGPMVNPSFPKKQLVGVFSLELARLYGYLYQQTDKRFVILHSLDGYDEISLTGAFKMITNDKEQILEPKDLGLEQLDAKALAGGTTIEESAKIFLDILEGKGTKAQNQVVIANAAMALYCGKQNLSMSQAVEAATESLKSGKALQTFKKLINK